MDQEHTPQTQWERERLIKGKKKKEEKEAAGWRRTGGALADRGGTRVASYAIADMQNMAEYASWSNSGLSV